MIDVDGKAFHATARWRQKEVGKIIAFAPALADHSMHYNPIDAVGRDPAAAWNEARLLADLLTGRNGPDEEARNFVAPAIYDVALNEAPERRHMGGVLARLACSNNQLDAWVAALSRSPHRELVRHGAALRELRPAKRDALVGRVLGELEVWRSPPIADSQRPLGLDAERPAPPRHALSLRRSPRHRPLRRGAADHRRADDRGAQSRQGGIARVDRHVVSRRACQPRPDGHRRARGRLRPGLRRAAVDVLREQRRHARRLSECRRHDRELRGALLRRARQRRPRRRSRCAWASSKACSAPRRGRCSPPPISPAPTSPARSSRWCDGQPPARLVLPGAPKAGQRRAR